ncbi:lysophospholipid acyltransferase family protein [Mucilaginibacter paludis]|nr:lysophospholipid acyltransferase family protein [Mucilaginibacter paludis]
MLKPKKNLLITGFFNLYINWIIKRHFQQVQFNRPDFKSDRSVLLIANHFSWWDGFLLYHVNQLVFNKKFHIMVLEDTMQKLSFLKYLGSFSVAKNSRQILQSLDYAADLLNDPDNMVVIFPQGKLYSNFVDDVHFEKGVTHIARKAKANFQYVLAATFIENFQYKKPAVNVYLKVFNVDNIAPDQLQQQYQQHYQKSKQQQTAITV